MAWVSGRSTFERVYSVIVLIKGVDGLGELVLGLVLVFAPAGVSDLLASIAGELAEGTSQVRLALAHSVGSAGASVATGATAFAVFLIVHGAVKVATVYCLIRRAVRLYPLAILVLSALLIVQWIDALAQPSVGAWVLAGLDVLVLGLVTWEYHRLRDARAHRAGPVT